MGGASRRRRSMSSIVPSPVSSSSSPFTSQEPPSHLRHWKFSQVLGDPPLAGGPDNGVLQDDADTLSAIEFDGRGDYLAAGDHAGRVILFQRTDENYLRSRAELERADYASAAAPPRYGYMTEFQSHEQEFDVLNSLEIGEKVKRVRWCARPNSSLCMLTANDRTVKLWKVSENKAKKRADQARRSAPVSSEIALIGEEVLGVANGYYLEWARKKHRGVPPGPAEDSDQVADVGDGYSAKCRRVYAHAHEYNINSISNNSDGETFVSADDLRINLWHLQVTNQCFNIVDMKPSDMEDLVEVITTAEFHPTSCNLLAYGSSRGFIRLVDLRRSALCDQNVRILKDRENHHQSRTFFAEIISCISDLKFTKDGRYVLSRDYMNLKLWDLHMDNSPVAAYKVHEYLRPKLSELYNDDYIFDNFNCCASNDGNHFATGSYSNTFKVFRRDAAHTNGIILEASTNPNRISSYNAKNQGLLNSLACGIHRKGHDGPRSGSCEEIACEMASKVTHLAWHPTENLLVCAANNSLYMYYT